MMRLTVSVGVFFELLRVITSSFLFLIFSAYADESPALQSSPFCFGAAVPSSICLLPVEYPLEIVYFSRDGSCGYPGFQVHCAFHKHKGRAFMNISNHLYNVLDIQYESKYINLVDIDVEGSGGGCPQPKRNFSFPSSPSWINYHLSANTYNITIFYNCSSVPSHAEDHLVCSQENYKTTNTPPSYAFYDYEFTEGFECVENVVVPIMYGYLEGFNYSDVIKQGFEMGWSATDWCEDCERSGGRCWSIHNSTATGCSCKHDNSYNRTCLQQISPRHQSTHLGLKIVIGAFAGIGGLLFLAVLLYTKKKIWMNKNENPIDVKEFLKSCGCLALHRYTYLDIKKITNSFKDKLGEGGYGQVFKGKLRDGRMVAVKVLNDSKGNGEDFINEVATIGRTNHVNVVTLVGYCIEVKRRALVYEFMPNGSLERFIYTPKEQTTISPLGWEKLYEIALGIARGLEYLHRGCNTHILHFDIKPHNILLDKDFCPKISDFGLAKLYPTRESVVSTVGTRGTMGYIAPELCYRNFGSVSHKSDVYSYGMMMLEMTGGRKNIDTTVENMSEIYFPFWIYNHLMRNPNAEELKDIKAKEVFESEKAKKMIIVALWCIQALPMERPSMSKVVEMLEGNTHDLQMPPNPSLDLRSSSSTPL